jgi:hypothetical protein
MVSAMHPLAYVIIQRSCMRWVDANAALQIGVCGKAPVVSTVP